MAPRLEPSEHLRSPLYWDGVDITHTETFDVPPPHMEMITTDQARFAEDMLISCALDVLQGMHLETDVPPGEESGSSTAQYPDGTVVILDTERLFHTDYSNAKPSGPGRIPSSYGPPIEEPFVSYWLQNQDPDEYDIFAGSEAAYFDGDNEFYGRALTWGVLLSSPEGERLVKTWRFTALRLTHEGVDLRATPEGDTEAYGWYRWVGRISISDRVAYPVARSTLPHLPQGGRLPQTRGGRQLAQEISTHNITRLRGARIIYSATGELPQPPSLDRFTDGRITARVA